jgi:hypothetical protein
MFQPIIVPRIDYIVDTFLIQTHQQQQHQHLVFHSDPMTDENTLNITTVFFNSNN